MKRLFAFLAVLSVLTIAVGWGIYAGAQEAIPQEPAKLNPPGEVQRPGDFSPPPGALQRPGVRPGPQEPWGRMAPDPNVQRPDLMHPGPTGGQMVANDKYVYILLGDRLLQYSADTLKLVNTAHLPKPERKDGPPKGLDGEGGR